MRYPLKITSNPLLRPLLAVFGVRHAGSYVDLEGGALTVHMGRWFHETVPLDQIASMSRSEWPWWGGLGVKLAPREGIGVVASAEGIVHIGLRSPRTMHVTLLSRDALRLWLSLEEPDVFLAALSAATGIPVSPPTGFWHEQPGRRA
jgi:hypothetical protein